MIKFNISFGEAAKYGRKAVEYVFFMDESDYKEFFAMLCDADVNKFDKEAYDRIMDRFRVEEILEK
jgi:hypothetical protein